MERIVRWDRALARQQGRNLVQDNPPSGSIIDPTLKNRSGQSSWRALTCAMMNTPQLWARRPSRSGSGQGISIAQVRANSGWSTSRTSSPEIGRKRLSGRFGGHDFSHLPLDRPLVPEDFPDPGSVQAARSRTEVIINLVRRDKPTLRQLLGYLARARALRHRRHARADCRFYRGLVPWRCGGRFQYHAAAAAGQLDVLSAEVTPILQRRGLFRTEYEGSMLREHYGLPWPGHVGGAISPLGPFDMIISISNGEACSGSW
jgi:hypothetical protein